MSLFLLMAALPSAPQVVVGVLARMDADGDGRVNAVEYAPFDDRGSFAAIDRDQSGQIDEPELSAYIRLTDPVRNVRAHSGVSVPITPMLPARAPTKSSGWIGGLVGIALLGLGVWRWSRR